MKYKTITLLGIAVMLAIPFLLQGYQAPSNRHHQHLEAAPKASCTSHDDETFCTHLPLMNIVTDSPIPDPYLRNEKGNIKLHDNDRPYFNDTMVPATVEFFDSPTQNNHLTDTPVVRERAMTRIRGNSSRRFDKKGYLLKFKEENLVDNKDISLAGLPADSDWVLHGPFLDRTLIRNYLCYNLAGEIMEYSPNVRFMELFLNEEYMGVYLLIEKINYNSDGRVNLTPTDADLPATSFILRLDAGDADAFHRLNTFSDFSGKRGVSNRRHEFFEILYPSTTLTADQKQYIVYQISAFEKSLASFDSGNPKKGYPSYIDVDSFVNFWILNEFAMNSDAGILSTYYYKDIRGKLKIAGWDYNSVFNNYIHDLSNPHSFYITNSWYQSLLRDPEFVDTLVNRYHQLRKTYLSHEYLMNYIDETVAYLGDAIDRNYEKWGYCFEMDFSSLVGEEMIEKGVLQPLSRNSKNHAESIQMLKDMIVEHSEFLDKSIDTLYARCHDSTNKQFRLPS